MSKSIFSFILFIQCGFLSAQMQVPVLDGIFLSAVSAFHHEPDVLFQDQLHELNVDTSNPINHEPLQKLLNSLVIRTGVIGKDIWGVAYHGKTFIAFKSKKFLNFQEVMITGKIFLFYGTTVSTPFKMPLGTTNPSIVATAHIFALGNSKYRKLTRSNLLRLIQNDRDMVAQLQNDDCSEEKLILYVLEYNKRHDDSSEY